ncbi:MAG: ABC transporter permease [Gemmatimonadota bacterium]|nr:ABC transporter permease [Gemmatimonadota bacterium]
MTLRGAVLRSPFWPMLWKEFVQMRRDRFTLAMMIGIPAVQILLFGYAIQTEVRNVPAVVLDESRSRASRELVAALENTGNFRITGTVSGRGELSATIGRGAASAGIVIPPDYARDIARGRPASAQVVVDAADPLSSQAAIGAAALAAQVISRRVAGAPGAPPRVDVRVRPWYNPALRSSTYIVPGIVGVLLSLTLILITSMAIVRERERGTLEQLVVTPITRTALMLGKIVPFVLVGYVQMTVILILGRLLFGVPIRGSILLLYLVAFAFIVANLAIGLFLSTLVRTQAQAMQLGFLFLLPNILLSGFMFPIAAMPGPAQWLGAALPLTYFLEVLRGILLKGVGMAALWPQTAILVGFAGLFILLSVRRFQKTIE